MLAKTQNNCIVFDVPYHNLDIQTVTKFKRNLLTIYLSSQYSNMVLNMEKVTFLDSAGLEALLFAGSLVQEANGKLSICCVNSLVKSILLQSRLYKYFDINKTLEESIDFINDDELMETCNYHVIRNKLQTIFS